MAEVEDSIVGDFGGLGVSRVVLLRAEEEAATLCDARWHWLRERCMVDVEEGAWWQGIGGVAVVSGERHGISCVLPDSTVLQVTTNWR